MRIALSQFRSPGTLDESVALHAKHASRAAERGCDLILFPELSLTGYEPPMAEHRAIEQTSPSLDPLAKIAVQHGLTIALGAPLRAHNGIMIGLVVLQPDGLRSKFAKTLLPTDEVPYFIPGDCCCDLLINGHRVTTGICFEAMQPSHGVAAIERGATIYAASVAKHEQGMAEAHCYFAAFAARHGVPVVLVNAVGENGGFVSSGGSAAWNAGGDLIDRLGSDPGLLIVDV